MANVESRAVINALPEQVFARVSDLQKHVEWSGGEAIRKTSDGAVAVGTTYETEEAGPLGRKITERSVVTDYQPNERFGWRTYGPVGTWLDWLFELRPEGSGTLLTQRLEPK
ncbi:MAG: SRPBCC family protein [Chloroflexi bacterium]|nr:SRPBCC family protein [Chloroflexota bacterium]